MYQHFIFGLAGGVAHFRFPEAVVKFQLFNDGVEACNITAPVSIQGAQLFQFCYKYLNDIPIEETKVPLAVIPIDHNNADEWMHWNDYEAALKYVNGIDGNGLGL